MEKFADSALDLDETQSKVAEFFNNCNVLITGGSGFVGKLLVEKLLRSCPKVNKLYLLMRAKKGKSPEERFKAHFEDSLYGRLKSEQPNFQEKVIMIEGGIDDNGLLLSEKNRELIKDSHVIFHGAATVRFDDKLRFAVNINIRGTRDILLFARKMPNLKAVVHVGTAFSHCVNKFIDEKFYKSAIDTDSLLTLLDILDNETLEYLTPKLIGEWPNTYAFTKSIAEDTVMKYSKGLPVCIVRPSIMIATSKEPFPGWINNFYGPTGVVIGAGLGLLHSLHCEANNIADIIPADYVINNIIVAAWDIGTRSKRNNNSVNVNKTLAMSNKITEVKDNDDGGGGGDDEEAPELRVPIFNCVSSCQQPITWGRFMELVEIYAKVIPATQSFWYYWLHLNNRLWLHNIYIFVGHFIPAVIIDTLARIVGRKPILLDTYRKIHKFSSVISYFCTQQWKFRNENVLKLWDKLNPVDKKSFFFNLEDLVWDDYYYDYARGVRMYVLGDPLSTIPQGEIRNNRLRILHYSVLTLSSLFALWLLFLIFSTLISLFINF